MREFTKSFIWAVLLGFVGTLVCIPIVKFCYVYITRPKPSPRYAVSYAQIKKIADAIAKYERSDNRRPDSLMTLVTRGLISSDDLFSRRRRRRPTFDITTGRFETNPDVLYFPGLRKEDPARLVLLCTIMPPGEGNSLLVVYNDYHTEELPPKKLRQAIQQTYYQLTKRLRTITTKPITTKPATAKPATTKPATTAPITTGAQKR